MPQSCLDMLRTFWEDEPGRLTATGHTFHLQAGEAPPYPANVKQEELTLVEQTFTLRCHDNELWLPGLYLWVQPDGATIIYTPEAATPTAAELWSLVFTEAHRAGGWLPLHAALMVAHGQAVALTGVSGAGKSTATLRLLEAGYIVLAEDRAFWNASGQVAGFDRWLRAFPDSVERFAPRLLSEALTGPRDVKGKLLLPLPQAPQRAKLTCVLLLADMPELSLPERVRILWETTGLPLTALGRSKVQQGVGKLLPFLSSQPVGRNDVPERIRNILGEPECLKYSLKTGEISTENLV